jgi:hypothetical protein
MFRKPIFFVFCLLLMGVLLPHAADAQSKTFNGNWEWKSRANAQKEQSVFWVDVKQKGDRVTGQYAFALLVDGENDGSDSSYVLFVGTVKGDVLTIEFDPNDIHGIYEEHTRYKRPRSPSTATLQVKNGQLQWSLAKGKVDTGDLGFPRQMTLHKLRY